MAIGAYTVALLMTHTSSNLSSSSWSPRRAAGLGLIIGLPATRLKGPYLAGMTLLLALAVPPDRRLVDRRVRRRPGLTTTVPTGSGTVNPEEWLAWIQIAAP